MLPTLLTFAAELEAAILPGPKGLPGSGAPFVAAATLGFCCSNVASPYSGCKFLGSCTFEGSSGYGDFDSSFSLSF